MNFIIQQINPTAEIASRVIALNYRLATNEFTCRVSQSSPSPRPTAIDGVSVLCQTSSLFFLRKTLVVATLCRQAPLSICVVISKPPKSLLCFIALSILRLACSLTDSTPRARTISGFSKLGQWFCCLAPQTELHHHSFIVDVRPQRIAWRSFIGPGIYPLLSLSRVIARLTSGPDISLPMRAKHSETCDGLRFAAPSTDFMRSQSLAFSSRCARGSYHTSPIAKPNLMSAIRASGKPYTALLASIKKYYLLSSHAVDSISVKGLVRLALRSQSPCESFAFYHEPQASL